MAKFCEICEKQTVAGKTKQHHHSIQWRFKAPKKSRTFKPNLKNVKLDVDGKLVNATVCMKCYKKLKNEAEKKAE